MERSCGVDNLESLKPLDFNLLRTSLDLFLLTSKTRNKQFKRALYDRL